MKKTYSLRIFLLILMSGLLSTSAFAQLSLGASADAEASTDEGVDAEGDAAADSAAEPEPEPAPASIADDETMLDEPVAADNGAAVGGDGVAGWDKGFYIKSGDGKFKLKINGMAKARFNWENDQWAVVGDNNEPGTNHTQHANFELPYARIMLTGHMFTDQLTYCIYHDFAVNSLVYAYADWAFMPDKLHIKVGQYKRPFSRNYLTSTVKRQFIRGPVGELGEATDVGIEVNNNYTKVEGIEWAAGVFNGSTGFNGDFSPVLSGRIGYNNGIKGYAPTDFEGGPFRFGVALSAQMEFDHDDNDTTEHHLGLDFLMKLHGLSVSAAVYLQATAANALFDQPDNRGEEMGISGIGTFVQGGYLLAERFEPVLRYGLLMDPRDVNYPPPNQEETLVNQEITAGLGIFFFENHFKWENNFSLFIDKDLNGDLTETENHLDMLFSSQMQFFF